MIDFGFMAYSYVHSKDTDTLCSDVPYPELLPLLGPQREYIFTHLTLYLFIYNYSYRKISELFSHLLYICYRIDFSEI